MFAVAASNASLGVFNSGSLVQRYQSDGPRLLLFDAQGQAISTTMQKPDIVGADSGKKKKSSCI